MKKLLAIAFIFSAFTSNTSFAQAQTTKTTKTAKIDTAAEIKTTLEFLKKAIEANGDKDASSTKGNSIEFEIIGYSDKADCHTYSGSYKFDFDLTTNTLTIKHIYSYECLIYKIDSALHRFQKEEIYRVPLKELGRLTNVGNDITITTKKVNPSISCLIKKMGGVTKKGRYQDQTNSNSSLSKDFKILNINQKDPKVVAEIIKKFNYLFTLIS